MDERIKLFQLAGTKAVEFQLRYLQPDGGYIWDGYADDAFHKQAYSWQMAGHFAEAHRLLSWVKRERQLPDGELKAYNGDIYKYSWFFQGAHRLGRFELSYPVMSFIISCQTPCGGFPHFAADTYLRSLSTCWSGVSAVYFNRLDVAMKAAEWAISVYHQQPDESRFYIRTTRDGRLATPDTVPEADALYVDYSRTKQDYWEIALPMQLMCRLYMATGMQRYLDYAKRFFALKLKCAEDRFTFVGSGKSSLGAALLYLLTGDEQARDAAVSFGEHLVATQTEQGGWRDPDYEPDDLLIHIDHAAEFNIWLQEVSACLAARG
jgi:hypothetical protein